MLSRSLSPTLVVLCPPSPPHHLTAPRTLFHPWYAARSGDRISWTGDAHLAQKAALAGFGGDFGTALVLNNTIRTQGVDNGIISYDLYFILSACDYFMHSGDTAALAGWAHLIEKKLQTSTSFWAKPVHQSFCGSDDRIGADFETSPPSESEKARYYKMLSVQAVNEYARATELCGAACPQAMHSNSQALAAAFAANFAREAPQLNQTYGMHSAAGAVLTGLTTPAEEQQIFDGLLANPAHVCSFAPFSTYFVLDAMGKLRLSGGRLQAMRAALAMVRRCYHGMNRLGATTYWETFSPEWLALFRPGEPTPNSQTGYMSHCHPWASGVAPWLSRSVLGLTPLAPGWSNFSVNPFLDPKAPNLLASVRGVQPLPRKRFIEAWFSCNGTGFLSVPASTTAGVVAIPLCDALPSSANLTINGKAVAAQPGDGCLIVRNLGPGRYAFAWQAARSHSRVAGDRASHLTTATSTTRPVYRDRFVRADNTTAGAWQSAGYGSAGHVFWSWRGASQDNTQLPPFVAGVDVQCHFTGVNARESKPNWVSPDSAPCSSDRRALQAPTTLVALPSLATALPKSSAPAAGCAGLGAYTCGAVATIDIMPAPGATQPTALNITLYLADWEGHGRKVAVELREYDNLQLAARTQLVRNFAEGVYLTWEVQSLPVRLRLMQVAQGLPYNNLMLAFSAVLFG